MAEAPKVDESEFPEEIASNLKELPVAEMERQIRLHERFAKGQTGGGRAPISASAT
jgi:hypothetical protein